MIERCSTLPPLCPTCFNGGHERFLGWNPDLRAFGCGARNEIGSPRPHVFSVGGKP